MESSGSRPGVGNFQAQPQFLCFSLHGERYAQLRFRKIQLGVETALGWMDGLHFGVVATIRVVAQFDAEQMGLFRTDKNVTIQLGDVQAAQRKTRFELKDGSQGAVVERGRVAFDPARRGGFSPFASGRGDVGAEVDDRFRLCGRPLEPHGDLLHS